MMRQNLQQEWVERITRARLGLDLGAPVMEQLVLTRLLATDEVVERLVTLRRDELD